MQSNELQEVTVAQGLMALDTMLDLICFDADENGGKVSLTKAVAYRELSQTRLILQEFAQDVPDPDTTMIGLTLPEINW